MVPLMRFLASQVTCRKKTAFINDETEHVGKLLDQILFFFGRQTLFSAGYAHLDKTMKSLLTLNAALPVGAAT
jgi:hypothetical protein